MTLRRRTVGLCVIATAALATSACTSFGELTGGAAGSAAASAASSQGTKVDAAASKPGVPSGPAFYTHPEPTVVATDPPVSAPTAGDVSVFVSYSAWNPQSKAVEVAGYLPGVVQDDGTCTLTLSQGGRKVTTTAPGAPNASTTSCGGLAVPGSKLSSGTWTAVLSYRSPRTRGSSDPAQVEVP